jgi:hypothetical protein
VLVEEEKKFPTAPFVAKKQTRKQMPLILCSIKYHKIFKNCATAKVISMESNPTTQN